MAVVMEDKPTVLSYNCTSTERMQSRRSTPPPLYPYRTVHGVFP